MQRAACLKSFTEWIKKRCGIMIMPRLLAQEFAVSYVKNVSLSLSLSPPTDKRLNSKGERRRADPAYEIMESRPLERNLEVGPFKKPLIRFNDINHRHILTAAHCAASSAKQCVRYRG